MRVKRLVELYRMTACDLPYVADGPNVTTHARLYSACVVQQKTGKPKPGRELWDGARLRELRDARGFSQEDLAGRSGVSAGDISRHERNDPKSNPSIDGLMRIAQALKVPPAALFEPAGSPIPRPEETTGRAAEGRPEGNPVFEAILARYGADAPAANTWQDDVLQAIAALARALRRAPTTQQSGEPPAKTGR